MNKLVTIRSNRYGLDIEFSPQAEFKELLEILGHKFKQSGRFFKDAQMALSFSGRELTREEEDRVLAVIRENTQIEILCIIEPNDKNEMMYRSVVEQSLSDIYKKEGGFLQRNFEKKAGIRSRRKHRNPWGCRTWGKSARKRQRHYYRYFIWLCQRRSIRRYICIYRSSFYAAKIS